MEVEMKPKIDEHEAPKHFNHRQEHSRPNVDLPKQNPFLSSSTYKLDSSIFNSNTNSVKMAKFDSDKSMKDCTCHGPPKVGMF